MRMKAGHLRWALAVAAVVAVASSVLTTYAESKIRPRGSFRVVVAHGDIGPTDSVGNSARATILPFLATFMGGGGVIASPIPLSCLASNEVMGQAHGQWDVKIKRGLPAVQFTLWADIFATGDAAGASKFEGSLEIQGTAPLSSDGVKGQVMMTFPAGHLCGQYFGGMSSFVATPLSATPPNAK